MSVIKDFVCVDIETTGVRTKEDRILEIGAVKVENGVITEKFSELINPGVKIPFLITRLTGIDDEMVKDCDSVDLVLKRFLDFSGESILLGHNLRFDYSFLKQNAINNNFPFEHKGIDTLYIARKVLCELESKSLESLCKYYEIEDKNHHRAYNDAFVTAQLYLKLAERFQDVKPEVFEPREIQINAKKVQPITLRQKKYLTDLCNYHNIVLDCDINMLSRSEASRKIDKILSEKGRILY